MELKTAKYDLKSYSNVYEPREDSFLMLDALELEITFLNNLNPVFALEVGSGSGVIITSLACVLEQCVFFAIDINDQACLATKNTSQLNQCNIEVLNSNLTDGLKDCLFDLVIFNPPYVVTDPGEYEKGMINKAWAGGVSGRNIIDEFIDKLPNVLSESGVCYLLLLKENDINAIQKILGKLNFTSEIILERKIVGEHLFIMKIRKIRGMNKCDLVIELK